MDRDTRDDGFAAGLITGTLIGAGLALLFAPRAGAELRSTLNDSMTSLRDAVSSRYHALAELAGVEIEQFEARVERAASAIEANAREVVDAARDRRGSSRL